MKKRIMGSILIVAMILGTLCGCQGTSGEQEKSPTEEAGGNTKTDTEASATEKDDEKIVIGVSFQGLSDEYIVRLSDAFKEKAEELGVTIQVADGQMNAEKQVGQVENFIAQKVDVIVLNPISADGCAPAVTAAREAGIPIITLISTTSNQEEANAYVGSDAIESGEIQGGMVVEDLEGKGNIVVMYGQMGHDAQIGRYTGLLNKLEGTDIEIIAEQTANWSREEGMKIGRAHV